MESLWDGSMVVAMVECLVLQQAQQKVVHWGNCLVCLADVMTVVLRVDEKEYY